MRPYEYGDDLAGEECVLALHRVAVRARTGRRAGPAAAPGPRAAACGSRSRGRCDADGISGGGDRFPSGPWNDP